MSLSNAPRFSEPREPKWFKRTARYEIERVRIVEPSPIMQIISDEEYQQATYLRVFYEIEQLRNCEPEITDITAEEFTSAHVWKTFKVAGGHYEALEEYLREDTYRWQTLCDWLEENAEYDAPEYDYAD